MLDEVSTSLLTTSPPPVLLADAERVARACFPGSVACTALSGERDVNFRVTRSDGSILTLKFVNAAELLAETQMQIEVLKHLEGTMAVQAPHHQPVDPDGLATLSGAQAGHTERGTTLDWIWYTPLSGGAPVRVRAYGYLQGEPGTSLKADAKAWETVGRTAAKLNRELQRFEHPAAHRKFLWDSCQVLDLQPLLGAVESAAKRALIAEFLTLFEQQVLPVIATMAKQIIHNDLSPSNILVDSSGLNLVGILDFGDMVYAPRIAEIAIAASYLMSYCEDPLVVLSQVIHGYTQEISLTPIEREHVLDLVLARLVQRMVITSWRATQFPENRDYILRSHATATALFNRVYGEWKQNLATRQDPARLHGTSL